MFFDTLLSYASMLTIRDDQLHSLESAMVASFPERVAIHLQKHCPKKTAGYSLEALKELVEHSFSRAAAWGFRSERDLLRFATLALFFGRDFDRDPAVPWAGRILRRRKVNPYRSKVDEMYETALEVLE